MQKQFYVSHNGKDLGPFTKNEISQKVESKELFPSDYVYLEDKDDWILLSEFVGVQTPPKIEEKTVKFEVPVEAVKTVSRSTVPATTASHAVTPTAKHNASVRFDHGEAKVSLRNEKAGKVTVQIENTQHPGLEVVGATEIMFHAGSAAQVHWDVATEATVGQAVKFSFKALDKFGNIDSKFSGTVRIEASQNVEGMGDLKFQNGVATKDIKATKAVSIEFKLSSATPGMDLGKTHRVIFKPGKATKLMVETKGEATVGEEVYITVKAVDSYGNVDTSFNDNVTVKLSGAMTESTSVMLKNGTGEARVS